MARPDPAPDPFDADLSAAREGVEYAGVARAIWEPRREPDAFARRCASNAIDAIDTALAALHRIRAEWITEIRQADDQAAARVDALLAQMRDGPRCRRLREAIARSPTQPRPGRKRPLRRL